jgi:hypothetical protein
MVNGRSDFEDSLSLLWFVRLEQDKLNPLSPPIFRLRGLDDKYITSPALLECALYFLDTISFNIFPFT